jgi:hypothetical protein
MSAQQTTQVKIADIMKTYLEFAPSFAPKYDAYRKNTYFQLNTKTKEIVNFLLENWKTPNYPNEKLIEVINPITDTKILDDLRNVLINSVITAFYEKNKQTTDLEIEDTTATQTLKPFIMINLENTIFRRTANFSTPYGFI